jgi:AraC-like DNA-binding protein
MSDRFKVSPLLAGRLGELRISLPAVLHHAGLPPGFFQQEKIYVSTAEFFALWRAIGASSADPAIGLKLGSESRLERSDAAAIAAVCSQSFRDAVQRMARYKRLMCPEEIRMHIEREEAAVEFAFLAAKETQPKVLADLCLAWILAIGRRGTDNQLTPLRLDLTRPIENRELLESHFGCRVRFKAGRNALIFLNSELDRPFVTHNRELLAAIGAQLENELQAQRDGAGVGEQVKQTLKRSLAGRRPSLQNIARELGLSVRTLQRRLTEAGLTFQELVEATRRELAHHYLRQGAVELTETAYLLGYEDANSFFRAFHLWEGTTPGEWRSQNAAVE